MIKMRFFPILIRGRNEKGRRDLNMGKRRMIGKVVREVKRKKVKRGNVENTIQNLCNGGFQYLTDISCKIFVACNCQQRQLCI